MIAGVFLQVERALFHLGEAGHGESVAVEFVDDVSRQKNGEVVLREQDKNSLAPKRRVLGDRSTDLWRTLQIWVEGNRDSDQWCRRYLLVTNSEPQGKIIDALRRPADRKRNIAVVAALIEAASGPTNRRGSGKSGTKIQQIIDDVISVGDAKLRELAGRIEVVENFDFRAMRPEVATRLGISPDVDRDILLDSLTGWIVDQLKLAWSAGTSGIISKEACLRHIDALERSMVRRRFLPRPASEVAVADTDVARARSRPFVNHLGRIESDNEEIFRAIEHFVQFNTERHRLAQEGEIPAEEWRNRGARLEERWRNVKRQVALDHGDKTRTIRGKHLLAATTYHHREVLAGQACDELYMTSGHYHRLADEDIVWWDPEFEGR